MLTLVVQAGGQSRRMGSDKGLLPFLGQPLIQRVIDRLAPMADEVLVTTNHPADYRFLDLPLFEDVIPGKGALGGLITALSAASQPLVAVVACDMPFASQPLFSFMVESLASSGADLAIPSSGKGLEPLHAVYRRETCLREAQAALDREQMKLISWFPKVQVLTISNQQVKAIDPDPHIFLNLNTPEDLQRAEKLAKNLR